MFPRPAFADTQVVACTERLTGEKPPADWWAWYRRRYPKRKAKEGKDG